MNNQLFKQQTPAERSKKLHSALKKRSGGALNDEMIGRILPRVKLSRQYKVAVFSGKTNFQEAVARKQNGNNTMSVVTPRVKHKRMPVAVVITPLESNAVKGSVRTILIYKPKGWKGRKYGQRP